jgi:hypothetical protein
MGTLHEDFGETFLNEKCFRKSFREKENGYSVFNHFLPKIVPCMRLCVKILHTLTGHTAH